MASTGEPGLDPGPISYEPVDHVEPPAPADADLLEGAYPLPQHRYGTYWGYCQYCGEAYTVTLHLQETQTRCPHCYTLNPTDGFQPQHLDL